MPNWTENTIRMEDIENKDLFTVIDGRKCFDFNKIIPEPKTKDECPTTFLRDDKCYAEKLEDRPWFNWYDWRWANWGTKWNACDTYIEGETVFFSTAWSYPEPIAYALSNMFPDQEIEWEYVDEDYNGNHVLTLKGGELMFEETNYLVENEEECEE